MPARLSVEDYIASARAMALPETGGLRYILGVYGLLGLCLGVFTGLSGNPAFLIWMLGYILSDGVFLWHAKRRAAALRMSRRQYWLLVVHYAQTVVYFCTLPVWLISMPAIEMQFAGLTLIAGLGLHGMIRHAALRDVLIVDALSVGVIAHAFAVQWGASAETTAAAAIMLVISSAITLFFWVSLYEFHKRTLAFAQAQVQVIHAQKMEAIGQLSAGIAHNFNNLLTVIAGNLDLHDEEADPQEQRKLRAEARAAVDRGAELVRKLLTASRRSEFEYAELGVAAFLRDVHAMVGRVLPANIHLSPMRLPPSDVVLTVDAAALEAVLLNLINNARDAMERGGGTLSLSAQVVRMNADSDVVAAGRLGPGRYLRIEVADTGHGIPRALLERVTDPYVTTKPEGKGTGLGLATAAGFAEQSGGALIVESSEGRGTRVGLLLPI